MFKSFQDAVHAVISLQRVSFVALYASVYLLNRKKYPEVPTGRGVLLHLQVSKGKALGSGAWDLRAAVQALPPGSNLLVKRQEQPNWAFTKPESCCASLCGAYALDFRFQGLSHMYGVWIRVQVLGCLVCAG